MFENLTDKLQRAFKTLRGQGTLTEENITEALAAIRVALLEADVNLNVARDLAAGPGSSDACGRRHRGAPDTGATDAAVTTGSAGPAASVSRRHAPLTQPAFSLHAQHCA